MLITGGTTGIGRATAILLAKWGANIFIFGRHQKDLDSALDNIKKESGHQGYGMLADVTDLDSLELVFENFDSTLGRFDALINNAGMAGRSIVNSTKEQIKQLIATNFTGYLYCAKLAIERMKKYESGHIINVGSLSAFTRDADTDLYVAAKAGVEGFNESLRKLISPGIKVSIIHSGSVGTEMIDESMEEQREAENQMLLLRAEDVALAILYMINQPPRVEILSIQLRAHRQII